MKTVYIFRELTLSDFYVDFFRIDSEVVFLDYMAAKKHADTIISKTSSNTSLRNYRYEIVGINVNCSFCYYNKEIYAINGDLLTKEEYKNSGFSVSHFVKPKAVPASEGDLVRIFENLECGESPFVKEIMGIVMPRTDKNVGDDLTLGYFEGDGRFSHRHDAGKLIKEVVPVLNCGAIGEELIKNYRKLAQCGAAEEGRQAAADGQRGGGC